MKKLLIKILLLLYCSVIISCKKKGEAIKTYDKTIKIDSFEYNLKNKEKIFLDFWVGIKFDDFYDVWKLLQSKNKMGKNRIGQPTYKLGGTEVDLSGGNYLHYLCGYDNLNNPNIKNVECIYMLLHSNAVKFFFDKYKITDYKEVDV